MKKYGFLLLVSILGLGAKAQVTRLPDGFTSGKTVWIVRVGASLNRVSDDGVDATKDSWEKQKPNSGGLLSSWVAHYNHEETTVHTVVAIPNISMTGVLLAMFQDY